jgi:hypothetical protein
MVMKKRTLFGLLTLFAALAFCLAFAACDSEDSSPDADFIRVVGEIDDRLAETIINNSGRFGKAALTPATCQYYIIRFVDTGEIISEGTIRYDPPCILFISIGETSAPAADDYELSVTPSDGKITASYAPDDPAATLVYAWSSTGVTDSGDEELEASRYW